MAVNTKYFLPQTKEVTTQADFVANGQKQIKLELPGYYTELILTVNLNVTPGTEASSATDFDAMVLKLLRIQADNSRPFLDLDDGRFLKYYNYFMAHGALYTPSLPSGGAPAADVVYRYRIHLGDYFTNPYDVPPDKVAPPSEVIATRDLSNLTFTIRWGDNGDLGTGYTIDASKSYAKLTVSYLLLQPGVSEAVAFAPREGFFGRVGFWQPGTQIQKERNITTTYSNLGYEANFLNGFWIKIV